MEVVMRRECRNYPLMYDRSASANGGVDVPFLHGLRSSSPLGGYRT